MPVSLFFREIRCYIGTSAFILGKFGTKISKFQYNVISRI